MFLGTFLCAKHFMRLLLESKDGDKASIEINSIAALMVRGMVATPGYCVSKTAQLRLMEMIHEQHNTTEGLLAYSVHPGGVATELSLGATPDAIHPFLVNSPELCGAFCV